MGNHGPEWAAAITAYMNHMLVRNPMGPGTVQMGEGCK